jgi:sulfide:quinone oxidoreductase
MAAAENYRVVIIGGGSGGITVAALLAQQLTGNNGSPQLAIIEPSTKHYYQPLWTLVGGGVFPRERTERNEADYIPKGAKWIQDAVTEFLPEQNTVKTRDGKEIHYEFLVVAAGIQLDWDKIPGLRKALGKNGVCSNYSYDSVESTWENIRNFKGGTAIFTQPPPPFKCGGAPQKICYLAEDYFRKNGVRDKTQVILCSAAPSIFHVKKYAATLDKVVARKGIIPKYRHNLTQLRPDSKEAVFKNLDSGEEVVLKYDMIHVTPPQSAPDFIKQSPLASKEGWVEVDKQTMQHVRYPNVFSLGDASSLPTSKTGAAIRSEAPILVKNLLEAMRGKQLSERYDGYTACPVVTGYGSLVMMEFDYDLQPKETFPFDQSKERYSMYLVKKWLLPHFYWTRMLKGRP